MGTGPSSTKKVLIIDDDPKICDLISVFLKISLNGINVVTARDTIQANFKLENEDFDLIIVDKNLPTRSGLDFITQLRSSFRYTNIKIILVSGSLSSTDVIFAGKNRVSDILVKPFKYSQFLKKVRKFL